MNTFFTDENGKKMGRLLVVLVTVAVLLVLMLFINQIKAFGAIGRDPAVQNTIDVTGEGTAYAVPDIATESFSVEQKSATVADAQATVTKNVNAAIAFLEKSGVAAADIQTTDYSANPEYDYSNPCNPGVMCPATVSTTPKLSDYDVSETVTVKIRNTDSVGTIVQGLGSLGVTGMNGPDFTVDNPDSVQAQARAQAITEAQAKAKTLASQLGVRLVRVVNFSENTGGIVTPIYKAMDATVGASAAPAAPTIAEGQNKYTSDVTITYEIK